MIRASLGCALPGILIALALLLPFHDKAFTIDDTLFLCQAKHVLHDPLHPTAFEMVWSDFPVPTPMSKLMPSGPVMAYLLVPCVLAGGQEWIGHLVVFLLFALGILATASLALRLGFARTQAGMAAALVAATPTALAMAGTCMPDIPAMSFGVLAIERLLAWRDERRLHQAIAGALALTLAALSRSHLILLWGVGALFVIGKFPSWKGWIETPRRLWLPLALAPALVVTALFLTRPPGDSAGALLKATRTFSGLRHVGPNLIGFSAHWTLVIPFALPWFAFHWKRMVNSPVVWAIFLVSGVGLLCMEQHQRFLLVAGAAAIGLGAVVDVLREGWKRRDAIQIGLGSWLLIALPITYYTHMPSKFQLASVPAAAILVAGALGTLSARTCRFAVGAIVAAGLVLGGLILKADAELGNVGRRASRELIAPNVTAGRRVWYIGHWGFQWYAEKAGAWCLHTESPPLARGDLVVTSWRTLGDVMQNRGPKRIGKVEDSGVGGRIMSLKLGAGFYNNGYGYLPWVWGDDVVDQYILWEM